MSSSFEISTNEKNKDILSKKHLGKQFNDEKQLKISALNEENRKKLENMNAEKEKEDKRIQDDHENNKAAREEKAAEELTKKHQLNISAPRPDYAPTPKMPTPEEIRQEAENQVEAAHKARMEGMEKAYEKRVERHLETSLINQRDRSREADRTR